VNNATLAFNRSGTVTQGTDFPNAISGTGEVIQKGAGTLILNTTNTYAGATTVSSGTLQVDGSISASSGVSISAGAKLTGHGVVSAIGGSGLVAPGDSQILTASSVDPSGGLDFTFRLTQPGAPDYASAAGSGNGLLHLTGAAPITLSLTSANTITIDFSGATLADGQFYYGGFFTDASASDSLLSGAGFAYTGLGGFTAQYAGLVAQPTANFATGTVTNGSVMAFHIVAVPEPGTTATGLLCIALLFARLLVRPNHRAKPFQ
jgi:autotransporter-associated beta strand protein